MIINEQDPLSQQTLAVIRAYETGQEKAQYLFDLYASALVRHVERVIENGILREYRRVEEESSFPVGRLLMNRTVLLQAKGVDHRAWASHFERTTDNAPNRCLKYTLWWMSQSQHLPRADGRKLRQQLNKLYAAFDGVPLDRSLRFLDNPVVTGRQELPPLRAYYRDALDVARAALMQRKIFLERSFSGVKLPSVVVDMNDLFERYVRRILEVFAAGAGWSEKVADGNTEAKRVLFTQHRTVGSGIQRLNVPTSFATPDIVISRGDGQGTACVLDVKNKIVKTRSDRDGEDQVIAYALRYATDRVVLVHPAKSGQKSGLYKVGDVGEVSLFQYRMDLAAVQPEAEERKFGNAMAVLIGSS